MYLVKLLLIEALDGLLTKYLSLFILIEKLWLHKL